MEIIEAYSMLKRQERSKQELPHCWEKGKIHSRSKIVKVKVKVGAKIKIKTKVKGMGIIMGVSDIIAGFIDEMLSEMGGSAELQRSELANRFNCVPSQINYVISTRFSPEHGYIVESRRGGGGFIRITRVVLEEEMLIMHTVNAIGGRVDINTAAALIANLQRGGAVGEAEARMLLSATGNNALRPARPEERDALRASILKQMLISLN